MVVVVLSAAGCGARQADEGTVDAPGILVFSGLATPPYLHQMNPDGSDLRGVTLPKTCSPQTFASGDMLVCFDLGDQADYAVVPRAEKWGRVPIPPEFTLPGWAGFGQYEVDAAQWSPMRDRVAYVRVDERPSAQWFSATGDIAVAEPDGSNESVLAAEGEAPQWSPDGTRLAFARCRWTDSDEPDPLTGHGVINCSLWTVKTREDGSPHLVVNDAQSPPVWSPDGLFIAFLRRQGSCESFCRYRVVIVPATGGEEREVGSELVEPSDGSGSWGGLAWLAGPLPTESSAPRADELELQRCVDIWNRARMHPGAGGAVNVSLVDARCQVTLRYYGGICSQMPEMLFRYDCPSHGAGLHMIEPKFRVWNAQSDDEGKLSLFDPPKGAHLSLPKVPAYPLVDGFVAPFDKDGQSLPGLRYTRTLAGTCDDALDEPDQGHPIRCGWGHFLHNKCFKPPGPLDVGDFALCPDYWRSADPMRFIKVTVTRVW